MKNYIAEKVKELKGGKKLCDCPCSGPFCSNLVHPCSKPLLHYSQRNQAYIELCQEVESFLTKALEETAEKARRDTLKPLVDIVNKQAEDEALWTLDRDAVTAYVQQELRKLHKAIEQDQLTKEKTK